MEEIRSKQEMEKLIAEEEFVLFYLSRPACGVCHALKPKIEKIAERYDNLKTVYFNLDNDETVAGQFSIFTIPGILVFARGREWIREARYISVEDIDSQLNRVARLLS